MNRCLHFVLLLLLLIGASSCSRILLRASGVKDPVVQTDATLQRFVSQKLKDTARASHALLQASDSSWAQAFLEVMSFEGSFELYGADGRRRCLQLQEEEVSSCEAAVFHFWKDSLEHRFIPFTDDSITLERRMAQIRFYFTETHPATQGYDYVVFARWAKYMQAKKEFRNNIYALERHWQQQGKKVLLIRLNTDLHDSWNLKPGYRVRTRIKRTGREIETAWGFSDIPPKTQESKYP